MTLIAIDFKTNGISETVLGDTRAIIANASANMPRPIFVNRVFFLWSDSGFVLDKTSIIAKHILSIPIVNNVIENIVIIASRARLGNPKINTSEDNIIETSPLTICSPFW